jgi:peroxin-16
VAPPIPEREFDPATLPDAAPASASTSPTLAPSSAPPSPPHTPVHLQNNHVPLALQPLLAPPPPLRAPAPVEEFLLPKALTPAGVRSPLALVRPMTGARDLAAEALHILRPLVYGPSRGGCGGWD